MLKFPSFSWVEVAFNGANQRGKILPVDKANPPEDGADHYRCLFRYQDELRRHVEKTGSVKGHEFPMYTDVIAWDVDVGEDLEQGQAQVETILERLFLMEVEAAAVRLAFSGNKGFHVTIPAALVDMVPSLDLYRRIRRFALDIAGTAKVDTAIYDKARLFRILNTRHGKSGLFKVQLPLGAVYWSSEQIREYAKEPKPSESIIPCGVNANLQAIWKKTEKEEAQRPAGISAPAGAPKFRKLCIHSLLQGVDEGNRHNAAFRLIDHYRSEGFPPEIARGMMQGWGHRTGAEEDWGKLVRDVYEGSYDYGCRDELLRSVCSEDCYLAKTAKIETGDLLTLEDRMIRYAEFVKGLQKKRFRTGFMEIDQEIRGVAPGEVLTVVAYSGTFKSALLQHFLLSGAKTQNEYTLFFSLEMPSEKVHEREVQMASGLAGFEVENAYASHDTDRLRASLSKAGAAKVLVCEKSGLTLEQIEGYIDLARKTHGAVGVVGIDYAGLMHAKGATEYEVVTKVFIGAKELAKRAAVPILMLSQVNRESAETEISMKSGKGTGAVEAASDFMLGMYMDEQRVVAKLLKNRNGAVGRQWVVDIERRSLRFRGLTVLASAPKKSGRKGF
jgi:KaiC/GvpD/RAD55 family RecA-like ATPase